MPETLPNKTTPMKGVVGDIPKGELANLVKMMPRAKMDMYEVMALFDKGYSNNKVHVEFKVGMERVKRIRDIWNYDKPKKLPVSQPTQPVVDRELDSRIERAQEGEAYMKIVAPTQPTQPTQMVVENTIDDVWEQYDDLKERYDKVVADNKALVEASLGSVAVSVLDLEKLLHYSPKKIRAAIKKLMEGGEKL